MTARDLGASGLRPGQSARRPRLWAARVLSACAVVGACAGALHAAPATTAPGASAAAGGVSVSRSTPHLSLTASLSARVLTVGDTVTVRVQVTPKPRVHVYAPGTSYRPIAFAVDAPVGLRALDATYPPATPYLFAPLQERTLVYSAPFEFSVPLRIESIAGPTARLPGSVSGTIAYQACDDAVCYLPARVPVSWRVTWREAAPTPAAR